MKIFYIPDGHRRYADRSGCSLLDAYWLGYRVLLTELIEPVLALPYVDRLDVFLLSNLNLERRDRGDLDVLLRDGEQMLQQLLERCKGLASIRTQGTYLPKNLEIPGPAGKQLNLVLGCKTQDDIGCEEVDVFLRTGGEIRLSGAPRSLIGNYTQFYGIEALHPDLKFGQVQACLEHYRNRYMRETAAGG
ncbi:MAG: undecaprenyl diphosphate synthase family protein [Bryobacterales bacterium]|nr:undecaprenyl diphosphate synthase family protein [Bryobacterales bacterium]